MTKQKNRLIQGTVILSLSGLVVKLISILYKWPLTNLVGYETMGYFNTVYPTYLILTALTLMGIPATISKLVAEEREAGRPEVAHAIFRSALMLSMGIGLCVSIAFIFLPFYAGVFAWEEEVRYVLWGLALAPFLIGISGAIRGYFQGMQNMVPTAVSQIIENIIKVLLGVGLVVIFLKRGLPDYISISGATIGISLGFVVTTGYLIWQYRKHKPKWGDFSQEGLGKSENFKRMGKILWIALPITLSTAMVSIMGLLDSTMIYRIYTAMGESREEARIALSSVTTVQTVINVPLAISAAIAVSVLPAIAVARMRRDERELNEKINIVMQLAMKMALPSMIGIMVLAEPILRILYRDADISPYLLQVYSLCMLFMILAQSVSSILQGLSGYYKSLLAVGIGVIIKLIFNYWFLNMGWGAVSLIYASIPYFAIIMAVNYWFLKKEVRFRLDTSMILWKPLLPSLVIGAVAYGVYWGVYTLVGRSVIAFILAVGLSIPIYALGLLFLRGFTSEEILILPKGKRILAFLQRKHWIESEEKNG